MSVVVAEGLRLSSGRYELESRLGTGAAATVWLARDTLLERPVAIKVLAEGLADDRAWLARFRREARVAARLQHPNLVSIYDFEAGGERPYLVMAYMPGGSLQERLDAGAGLDSGRLATDLLSALAHIHAAGIVHRDVKPANVMFDRDGRACLTDFGVARPKDATSITQTGQIPGTARYMAPELWRGEPATQRSDLYSCGVLLSECLTAEAPRPLVTLAGRLRADEPDARPESALAALGDLGVAESVPPPAPEPPTEPLGPEAARPESPGSRRWVPVAALCAVAMVAGILLANTLGGDDDPGTPAQRDRGADASPPPDQPAEPPAGETTTDEPTADEPTAGNTEPPPTGLITNPYALNDQGKALIDQGRYEEAIPLLERAVDGLEGSGNITYAYALYNLAHALRLAGRPAEAIPLLEERLEIPDQLSEVEAELKAAEEDLKAQEKAAEKQEKAAEKDDD